VPFHRYGLVDPPHAGGGGFIVHAHHLGVDQNRIGVPVLGHLRGDLLGMQREGKQNEQRYGTHAAARVMNRFRFADSMHRSSLSFLIRNSYSEQFVALYLIGEAGKGKVSSKS
jgi:hypothetical protein